MIMAIMMIRDNNEENKKVKGTKNCVIKGKLKFQDLSIRKS